MARMAGRIAVMYAGRVVESAPTEELFARPRHPYTVGLLRSIPRIGGARRALVPIEGSPPDLERLPEGCPFAPRCAWRIEACWTQNPSLATDDGPAHLVACHDPAEPEEVGPGRPIRPGFAPAPPPGIRAGVA
jgi:oligopeptide/dipeptide ABC transporter ATP-binding protein